MATLSVQGFRMLAEAIVASARLRIGDRPLAAGRPERGPAERDFVNEVIWENPGAFSGDLDIQHMMQMFPGRF